jgi:adenylate kinase
MISLLVSEEELVKRLLNRGLTSGRSDDTNEEVIRARIIEYRNKTSVVADYYRQFDKLAEIKGEGSINEIFEALQNEIEKHMIV